MSNVPYTYLLKWTSTGMKYYGVRYAKGCTPTDLWVKYFTSSDLVKEYVESHGNPDIIQIRKVFDTADSARKWEERVLKKLGVVSRNDYLNATDNICFSVRSGPDHPRYGMTGERPDLKKLSNTKWYNNGVINKRLSETEVIDGFVLGRLPINNTKLIEFNQSRRGKPLSKEHGQRIANAQRGKPRSTETKEKIRQTLLKKRLRLLNHSQ